MDASKAPGRSMRRLEGADTTPGPIPIRYHAADAATSIEEANLNLDAWPGSIAAITPFRDPAGHIWEIGRQAASLILSHGE
jgi:hypothetical protein